LLLSLPVCTPQSLQHGFRRKYHFLAKFFFLAEVGFPVVTRMLRIFLGGMRVKPSSCKDIPASVDGIIELIWVRTIYL
jgi:hypothetical protein